MVFGGVCWTSVLLNVFGGRFDGVFVEVLVGLYVVECRNPGGLETIATGGNPGVVGGFDCVFTSMVTGFKLAGGVPVDGGVDFSTEEYVSSGDLPVIGAFPVDNVWLFGMSSGSDLALVACEEELDSVTGVASDAVVDEGTEEVVVLTFEDVKNGKNEVGVSVAESEVAKEAAAEVVVAADVVAAAEVELDLVIGVSLLGSSVLETSLLLGSFFLGSLFGLLSCGVRLAFLFFLFLLLFLLLCFAGCFLASSGCSRWRSSSMCFCERSFRSLLFLINSALHFSTF